MTKSEYLKEDIKMKDYVYAVSLSGGLGPNVWDTEVIIQAASIHEAIHKVEEFRLNGSGEIVAINQKD